MFYEGRVSTVWKIDKEEIVSVLKGDGKKLKHAKKQDGTPYQASLYTEVLYVFEHNGKTYGFANDETTCEGITELAILDIDKMTQIESLTIGWVTGNKTKAILDCCDNPCIMKKTGLVIKDDKIISQPETMYTCGCCGTGFYSTHKEQRKFDQDSGFGICPDCAKDY